MAKSDLEARFLEIWHDEAKRNGMTVEEPEREVTFHPLRRWRLDFAWPRFKVAVEIDGGIFINGRHTDAMGGHHDRTKGNAAARMGWRVLRYDARHLSDSPEDVFAEIIDTMCCGLTGEKKAR